MLRSNINAFHAEKAGMFANLKNHRAEDWRKRSESAFERLGISGSEDDDDDDDGYSTSSRQSFDLEPTVPDYLKNPASNSSTKETKQTELDFFKSFDKLLPAEDYEEDDSEGGKEEEEGEKRRGDDEEDQGNWTANKVQGNDYDLAGILPVEGVATPALSVARKPPTITRSLVEQSTQPCKDKQRAEQGSMTSSSDRGLPAENGRRKVRADKGASLTPFTMGFQSSPTTAGISIPASLVIRLPERTTPGNRTIPRKRTNPIDEAKINRKTNSSKSDYPINVAKKRRITSRHTRESRVQPQTKQNAAKKKSSRTPTGFQILSGENLHQAGESSERRGPASAVTTTSSQSPPAYAFYIDPRPLLTPQRQLPSAQPLQRRRHILPPKAGEIKAQHPQSQLPYHSPTKDFMILVSPRRLPQHNGSSTFFELVDEERYIKTAQYPLSRDIDRRQAGIERMRYPLFFAPPLTSGREVT